ncbi:MAG TPA: DUF2127 domain-containing protein [Candidatus Saccharimonadia bacterium]
MTWFKPKNILDRFFEAGIIIKGVNGAAELIGGTLLLVVSPATLNNLVVSVTQGELSEDPHDFIATRLLQIAHHLTPSTQHLGAAYLLAHGAIKIILAVAVLKQKLWAYPWLLGFLLVFIAYQTYRLTFAPSLGLAALTIFDIVMAWLTYLEYRQHKADWA